MTNGTSQRLRKGYQPRGSGFGHEPLAARSRKLPDDIIGKPLELPTML
jgi:hypothetical protein